MITIMCGGKVSKGWLAEGVAEYERRIGKPFEVRWEFWEEKKLVEKLLEREADRQNEFLIVLDERGVIKTSPEIAEILAGEFSRGKEVRMVIGGAFGVPEEVRRRADLVWSFSKLVFPHQLMRLMVMEQIYRAQEIGRGGKYHHG